MGTASATAGEIVMTVIVFVIIAAVFGWLIYRIKLAQTPKVYDYTVENCPNKGKYPVWKTFTARQGPSPEGDGPAISACSLCGYGQIAHDWEGSPFRDPGLDAHP